MALLPTVPMPISVGMYFVLYVNNKNTIKSQKFTDNKTVIDCNKTLSHLSFCGLFSGVHAVHT